jgi:hypothetical protein
MNSPVNQAIQGLQQSLTTLQTNMLQSNLISSQAILRTIRASNSLEDAQVAWGRFLNLPGRADAKGSMDAGSGTGSGDIASGLGKRQQVKTLKLPLADGKFYTHEELWGGKAKRTDTGAVQGKRVVHTGAENGRIGRTFVIWVLSVPYRSWFCHMTHNAFNETPTSGPHQDPTKHEVWTWTTFCILTLR